MNESISKIVKTILVVLCVLLAVEVISFLYLVFWVGMKGWTLAVCGIEVACHLWLIRYVARYIRRHSPQKP